MNRSRIMHFLRESGLCFDSVRLLDFIAGRGWARVLAFRFMRLRFSPAVLEDALRRETGPEEKGRLYSLGMSYVNVGDTYKTTGRVRTSLADARVLELAGHFKAPRLVEIGVSDGVSALSLLASKKSFGSVVLTDRFNRFYEKRIPLGRIFLDADGRLLGIKVLCLYANLAGSGLRDSSGYAAIETANPELARLHGIRTIDRFDMLRDALEEKAQIIKCANILNPSYFTGTQMRAAAENLSRSLTEGGVLVVSHNNEAYAGGEAVLVLKKRGGTLRVAEDVNGLRAAPYLTGESLEKRLRILFLAPTLDVGGAERQMVQLANGLAEQGHEVEVALFNRRGSLLDRVSPSVTVHDLKKGGRWDLVPFLPRLAGLFRDRRPDVVYSFLGVPNLACGLLLPLFPTIRFVWSVRASDMDMSRYDLLSRLCARAEPLLSPLAHGIVVNSGAGAEHAVRQGFPEAGLTVIPNGMDVDALRPDPVAGKQVRRGWGVPGGSPLVGCVARLDPMKDHATFFRAAQRVVEARTDAWFVCVGSGPLEMELRGLVRELGLESRVVWAGTRNDMLAVYNALDVCCLSSVTEGFPNVLGEAMSCGVPCVATDVGDVRHIVGDLCPVVARRAPGAMAEAVLRIVREPGRFGGDPLRERIIANFSLERAVERTGLFLSELIGN